MPFASEGFLPAREPIQHVVCGTNTIHKGLSTTEQHSFDNASVARVACQGNPVPCAGGDQKLYGGRRLGEGRPSPRLAALDVPSPKSGRGWNGGGWHEGEYQIRRYGWVRRVRAGETPALPGGRTHPARNL